MKVLANLFVFMALVISIFIFSCERKTSTANLNMPPNTTIANIPVDSTTLFALQTLHWDGEDNDGFISSYQYRYVTYHQVLGDSFVQDWQQTNETSVIIPFESSDELNLQKFEVRAVDNNGDMDPTPAQKIFFTKKTIFPVTEVVSPVQGQQFFAIDHTTDWWPGIHLVFTARDEDRDPQTGEIVGRVVQYAWAVDNGEWNWVQDTSIYIAPEYFNTLEGEHTIRVTCRDNTNLVDPVGDSVKVNLLTPQFNKDLLIVDETDESQFSFGLNFSDAEVDSFYARIFPGGDSWDFKRSGMPPKDVLGQYKVVIWHADNAFTNETNLHKLPQHIGVIMDYLNVGGNFIMSGWRMLKSFAHTEAFPKTFEEGSFIHDYLHILEADESALVPTDFDRVLVYKGDEVTDTLFVDGQKLIEWPWSGKLGQINVVLRQAGFTDRFFGYGNDDATGDPKYRNAAIGLRYYGTSFRAIVLGFPLFFIKEDDAAIMARNMLTSLGL